MEVVLLQLLRLVRAGRAVGAGGGPAGRAACAVHRVVVEVSCFLLEEGRVVVRVAGLLSWVAGVVLLVLLVLQSSVARPAPALARVTSVAAAVAGLVPAHNSLLLLLGNSFLAWLIVW